MLMLVTPFHCLPLRRSASARNRSQRRLLAIPAAPPGTGSRPLAPARDLCEDRQGLCPTGRGTFRPARGVLPQSPTGRLDAASDDTLPPAPCAYFVVSN